MLTSYGVLTVIFITTVISLVKASLCTCPGVHGEIQTTRFQEQKLNEVIEQVTERHRKRCCPYNFDGTICRNVGNRILCGYNRNIGSPDVNDEGVNLNNGCRLKNGRLECGYDQPPYINFRRPPGWDSDEQPKQSKVYESATGEALLKLYTKLNTVVPKVTTRCLEVRERIVCKNI